MTRLPVAFRLALLMVAILFPLCKTYADTLPDLSVVFSAPETTTQRQLRFIRGLIDLGSYDMALVESSKLAGRIQLNDSAEQANISMEAASLALKAAASLWVSAESEQRLSLENSILILRKNIEGAQASETIFSFPASGNMSVRLRYAASLLEYYTSRAIVLRCQNRVEDAARVLKPLLSFDVPVPTMPASDTDNFGWEISTVQRRMEFVFARERMREESIACGLLRRDTPGNVAPFAVGLTSNDSDLFDAFVKYLDLRAARFAGRVEEATACLSAAMASKEAARFSAGITAERLRLAILAGTANNELAATDSGVSVATPFTLPLGDDLLAKSLYDELEMARFELLLAAGKVKNSEQKLQSEITKQLQIIKSVCSPVVRRQVETLLEQGGHDSRDAGMAETAAESAWRDGRMAEAVALYDTASQRARAANKPGEAFRLAAASAAILKRQLETNSQSLQTRPLEQTSNSSQKIESEKVELLNRFIRLGRDFPGERHANDFLSAALDLAVDLLPSGNFSFDEYLKLRIEYLLRSSDRTQKEEFRFRTIALALRNHRVEPAILLLKEDPSCAQVSQTILAVVADGIRKILLGEEPLGQSIALREVAEVFLSWDSELKKDRSVPLHWSDDQNRTLNLCRGRALLLTGHDADAFKRFALLLKDYPNDLDVLESLATILSARTTNAELDRAIELWSRVVAGSTSGSPRAIHAQEQLIPLLKRRGRNEAAERLERLIRLERKAND